MRKTPEERLGECVREMGIDAAEKQIKLLKAYAGAEKRPVKPASSKAAAVKATTASLKTD